MSKYAALGNYLSRQSVARVQLSFADIERITGGKLPVSQRYPAWWSNNPTNNPMTRVWLDAGFRTEQVDIAGRKLVFRKAAASDAELESGNVSHEEKANVGDHPLFIRLRGTVHVPDGVDLTEPADPAWGDLAYGNVDENGRG
jgi:hypothetical protein